MGSNTREASVKLTLDGGQFLVEMRRVGDEVETTQKKGAQSTGVWGKGVEAVGGKFKELGGHVRNVIGLAATLGGAFSMAQAVQQTLALEGSFKDLAIAARDGSGEIVNWHDLQTEAMGTATNWSRANDEVAQSLATIRDEVGDLDFARGTIDEIAKQATRTGKPMSVLSGIVGALNEQFGIAEDQVPDALQAVIEGGNKGGVTIEQLSAQLEKVGPSAQLAGLQGAEGLKQVLGMLNQVEGHVKKPFMAVSKFLDMFASPEFRQKAITLGVKVGKEGDPSKMLEEVMRKTKGAKKELEKLFQGEQLKVAVELGKTFAENFEKASGTVAQRTDVASAAFSKALTDAGKTARSAADIEAEARKRLAEPHRRLQEAMNTLAEAVAQPEIIEALKDLAALAPSLAKEIAGLIKWVSKHPLLAGAGAAGGMVVNTFASGVVSAAGAEFMKAAFAGGAMNAAGGSFAAAAFGPAVILVAAAALGAAVGNYIQDRIEKADADRRKRKADTLRGELAEDFKKTGKQRALTAAERLTLAEGGKEGEEAPTGTDLGQAREKFQRDEANRADVQAMGFDPDKLGGGAAGEGVIRLSGLEEMHARENKRDKEGKEIPGSSMLPAYKPGEGPVQIVPTGGIKYDPNAPKHAPEAPHRINETAEAFATSLRRNVMRVEVVNPAGTPALRGPPSLPTPAPK